jgi:hypothetical protein
MHRREPTPIDKQTVIRMNRDTLYSAAVFDLDAGAVTIALPDAHGRFMSMQVIDEDEYAREVDDYRPGGHTFTKLGMGRAMCWRPSAPWSIPTTRKTHALQDAIKFDQPGDPGAFEAPIGTWRARRRRVTRSSSSRRNCPTPKACSGKTDVDPVRHLIGAASAWGGNPEQDALYLNVTPANNDRTTVYKLHVKDVPVDGF